jgi:hypothetical protein
MEKRMERTQIWPTSEMPSLMQTSNAKLHMRDLTRDLCDIHIFNRAACMNVLVYLNCI